MLRVLPLLPFVLGVCFAAGPLTNDGELGGSENIWQRVASKWKYWRCFHNFGFLSQSHRGCLVRSNGWGARNSGIRILRRWGSARDIQQDLEPLPRAGATNAKTRAKKWKQFWLPQSIKSTALSILHSRWSLKWYFVNFDTFVSQL